MLPSRRRPLAALLVLLLLAVGACDRDGDGDDVGGSADDTSTTVGRGEDGDADAGTDDADGTTTSVVGGGAPATSAPGPTSSAPPTSAPPAAADDEGVIELTISGGNVEGGVRRETVKQGAQVTIRATSDTADELHVHGYDLEVALVPNQSSDLTFLAKTAGVFEVELEGRGRKVLELEVTPSR